MKRSLYIEIDRLADHAGADGWVLVRCGRHAVVDFIFPQGAVRQVFAISPSDVRAKLARRTSLRRAARRAVG